MAPHNQQCLHNYTCTHQPQPYYHLYSVGESLNVFPNNHHHQKPFWTHCFLRPSADFPMPNPPYLYKT